MLDKSATVQGMGVYAEYRMNKSVTQLLVTPDGYGEDGELVGIGVIRRVVTPKNADPAWSITVLPAPDLGTVPVTGFDEQYAAERFKEPTTLLDQLVKGGWEAVGPAFLVEVTSKDLLDVADRRRPSKLLYRVELCRNALDYPNTIQEEEEL